MRRIARRLLAVSIALAALPAAPALAHGGHGGHGDGVLTHADTRAELALVDVAATAAAADAPGALPYAWCGDERTTDDVVHSALPAAAPRWPIGARAAPPHATFEPAARPGAVG